jgi:hypothetical protein
MSSKKCRTRLVITRRLMLPPNYYCLSEGAPAEIAEQRYISEMSDEPFLWT